ncbi:MAG: tetratricopeptide repeat protein, partial [Planctomycetaceae bacterium]|nr:tetratricopeptide repeat protein [Planctomycetaceae bacterium]
MNQQNIDYLSLLGYQYLSHGRFGAAVAVIEGALVLEPDDGNLKRSLAYAYLNLGRCQECLEILERIGEPEDREPVALLEL